MALASSNSFPITITFDRAKYSKTYDSPNQLGDWLVSERNFWGAVTPQIGGSNPLINQNLQLIARTQNTADFLAVLISIAAQYVPSDSPFGLAFREMFSRNQQGASIAFSEFLTPGRMQFNPTSQNVEGSVAGAIYRIWGDPENLLVRINSALQAVETLKITETENTARYAQLITEANNDWKNRIEGYEAKVALKAPKEYWSNRASVHDGLAKEARRSWDRWLVGIAAISLVLAALVFLPFGDSLLHLLEKALGVAPAIGTTSLDPISQIGDLIRRVFVVGTALAIGVWWLRQKLRDLRSHEHFAEDAAERATMVETYAAMRGAGLQTNDLTPIIAALYRPASTGFMDDTGPALPFEIIMRTVADAAARVRGKK